MKLIIIHGPPAAGKLTVANEVARLTGFKVFHNHLSIDCVKPVFEFGSEPFWRIVLKIREETIAEATRAGVDIIHTFCYAKDTDDEEFAKLIAAAEDNGGEVHTVLLLCDDEERRKRIANESRVLIGKLTDPDSVTRSRAEYDLESPFPGRETLIIDTTHVVPEASAARIIAHFKLQERQSI
ncbi:MAG TPA: AAA family ATPase [Pyrinomonadaceae bacterium]